MLDKDESEELYITVEIITDLEVIFQKSALSVSHQRNESVYTDDLF